VGRATDFNVRLKGDSSDYTNAVFKGKAANDAFNRSVGGVSKGLTAINGPLNGVTGRFTAIGSLATSNAGKFALFGAALAASSLAVAAAVKEFDGYERQQLKVQQLLETTGYAAGLSAQELSKNADAVALATLASVAEIQDAQGVLLSFKSVQEETFTSAIMMAQDMAAVFGGSAKEKALQLGKALESPAEQLTALKKSGVSFTKGEQEMIKQMDATGRKAEAQRFILEKLAEQVGGTGAAQAKGLSGSVDTLGQHWDELQRKFAASSGSAATVQSWVDSLASSFKELGEEIEPSVEGLTAKLEKLQATIYVGRNKANLEGNLAGRIEAIRQQIQLAKAESGDMDALNSVIERTRTNINALESSASKAGAPKRQRGQMGRKHTSENGELTEQKQHLKDLVAMQKEFTRQKELSVQTQKAMNESAEQESLLARQAKARPGLDSVIAAQESRAERELAASERRQEMLDEAANSKLISEIRWNELTENNWQAHQDKITDIQSKASKKRAKDEAAVQAAAYVAIGNSAGQFMDALEGVGEKRSALYKTMFLAQKAAAIPGMITSTEEAATKTLALDPTGTTGSFVRAMGYASVGVVAGQAIAGVAHGGMGYIPEESTYLLQKGEGVLSPKQNAEVQKMALDFNGGKSSAAPLVVNIIEDASRAGQVHESTGPDGERMIEAFVANIRQGGPAADVIEQTYQVQRVGR